MNLCENFEIGVFYIAVTSFAERRENTKNVSIFLFKEYFRESDRK